jgi:hypothetical protein
MMTGAGQCAVDLSVLVGHGWESVTFDNSCTAYPLSYFSRTDHATTFRFYTWENREQCQTFDLVLTRMFIYYPAEGHWPS